MNHCAVSAAEARHAEKEGRKDVADAAWSSHREELLARLMAGRALWLDHRPLIDINDLESEMAEDENVRSAIVCCHRDEVGAGALLAVAKRAAANRLIDQYEDSLRAQFERPEEEPVTTYTHGEEAA